MLTLSEVKEYTVVEEPETLWERIGTGFMNSLKGQTAIRKNIKAVSRLQLIATSTLHFIMQAQRLTMAL